MIVFSFFFFFNFRIGSQPLPNSISVTLCLTYCLRVDEWSASGFLLCSSHCHHSDKCKVYVFRFVFLLISIWEPALLTRSKNLAFPLSHEHLMPSALGMGLLSEDLDYLWEGRRSLPWPLIFMQPWSAMCDTDPFFLSWQNPSWSPLCLLLPACSLGPSIALVVKDLGSSPCGASQPSG